MDQADKHGYSDQMENYILCKFVIVLSPWAILDDDPRYGQMSYASHLDGPFAVAQNALAVQKRQSPESW